MEHIIYHDYANWKLENDDFIQKLKDSDSSIFKRFKHVLGVLDYLYDRIVEGKPLVDDEENIFETGFFYIFDQFNSLKLICDNDYHGDISRMHENAKTIHLLMNTIDFQTELLNVDSHDENDMETLIEFEDKVMTYLENNQEAPDEMFVLLDDLSEKIFTALNVEYYPITDIFLDIADEFGLIDEEEYLVYEV